MENFKYLWCVRAFDGPVRAKNRLTQGLVNTPRISVSCRFQNSKIRVFMSIDMACRLNRNADTYMCTYKCVIVLPINIRPHKSVYPRAYLQVSVSSSNYQKARVCVWRVWCVFVLYVL
jgi:hypothetical protein